MSETIISLKDVTLSYANTRDEAVNHATFEIYAGENLCVVGANGSGKSTLLKGIMGLKQPDSGTITVKKGLKRAYLAQMHTSHRDFPATVHEIVLSGTQDERFFVTYSCEKRRRAEEAMALLKIDDLGGKRIGDLSGGQQQRVFLARSIAAAPDLLVLDEPVSALDPAITHDMYDLFEMLNREKGITLVSSTHDWDYVKHNASRVLVVDRGVEYIGSVDGWKGNREAHTCRH